MSHNIKHRRASGGTTTGSQRKPASDALPLSQLRETLEPPCGHGGYHSERIRSDA